MIWSVFSDKMWIPLYIAKNPHDYFRLGFYTVLYPDFFIPYDLVILLKNVDISLYRNVSPMPRLLRKKMDSSLYRDESTFLRKATEYIGQNNVRQMYREAMTGFVKSHTRSMLCDITIIVNRYNATFLH